MGNNDRLKRDLKAIDRRFDRMGHKLDHWERRAAFYSEGMIKGKAFRFERWQAAQAKKLREEEARRKAAHARKRVEQIRALMKLLDGMTRGVQRGREAGLVRSREVAGWLRSSAERDRSRGRERGQ